MATNAKQPPSAIATNGVITAPVGNRKKQKRRAKQAAKAAASTGAQSQQTEDHQDTGYDEDALGFEQDEEDGYSDQEPEYDDHLPTNGAHPPSLSKSKKRNKKKKTLDHDHHQHGSEYESSMLPPPPQNVLTSPGTSRPPVRHSESQLNIWSSDSAQERQNIKQFWLSLSEDERKSLLKIEKEAVLKKMKQQQKHSCSCTVCGRKRTAIEEELEVLYEGYYEELEQYAHHDNPPLPDARGMMPDPLQHRPPHPLDVRPPSPAPLPHHKTSHMREHLEEDEEEYSDEEDEEEYSEDEEEYSEDEPDLEPVPPQPQGRPAVQDFFSFGSHLTVKDNLLTVADDLLKNDGRKFIEMMEQLAERRMQRENRSQYESDAHAGYPPADVNYDHDDNMVAGDEFDDDEASYDSQEDYDDDMDEEDDMVGDIQTVRFPNYKRADYLQAGLTEEQRMQEGRRMFQIFAARMFEQRVLVAYKEQVARQRQAQLLEELENEKTLDAQKEAKKQRDAAKKKEKKKHQQQMKAEEKARKDAEKAEEEAKLRIAEEKKLEEQRRKKEEQRKKRDDEKRKQEEERTRKEAEKQRRQQEEQQRREEQERKARETKAAEKARKEEIRKREREEREAREKEARERKIEEEKEKREREAKAKAEKEAKEREKSAQQAAHPPQHLQHPPQIVKRPSQAGMVAVPGVYPKPTASGISSPHPQIATPAVGGKAQNSAKQRQVSQQASQASSPKQAHSHLSSGPSKSPSPSNIGQQQQMSIQPKIIMQKANIQQAGGQHNQHPMPSHSPIGHQSIQPPPGMPLHPQHASGPFGNIPPIGGFPGFQGPHGSMLPNMNQRGPIQHQMFAPPGPPIGMPNRLSFPGMNGMAPPPGMMGQPGRGFPAFEGAAQPPPGFGQYPSPHPNQTSPIGQTPGNMINDSQRSGLPGHSRQQSGNEKERFEFAANQPIGRPAPIQRPNSVKPNGPERSESADIDELSKHLGSSALLDDADDPIPPGLAENRRHSNIPVQSRNMNIPTGGLGQLGGFGTPGLGTPGPSWNAPNMGGFGQSPSLGPSWGSLPAPGMHSWGHSNGGPFSSNGAFGSMAPGPMHRGPGVGLSRPLTIRLAVCQACSQLTMVQHGEGDGFHDVNVLLRQIDSNRPMLDSPPSLREIEEICETEGDSQNGGGELHVRKNQGDASFAVKWEPDAGTPDQGRGHSALGEIGSPMPSKISPAMGSAPFGGFGAAPGLRRPTNSFASVQPLGPPSRTDPN